MPIRALLTYSDYAALPDDGRRYELHWGELSVTPAPGTRHQGAIVNLIALLHEHVRSRGLGKVFVDRIEERPESGVGRQAVIHRRVLRGIGAPYGVHPSGSLIQ